MLQRGTLKLTVWSRDIIMSRPPIYVIVLYQKQTSCIILPSWGGLGVPSGWVWMLEVRSGPSGNLGQSVFCMMLWNLDRSSLSFDCALTWLWTTNGSKTRVGALMIYLMLCISCRGLACWVVSSSFQINWRILYAALPQFARCRYIDCCPVWRPDCLCITHTWRGPTGQLLARIWAPTPETLRATPNWPLYYKVSW